jgi:hypothetical protein
LEDQLVEWKAYAEALEASQPLRQRLDGARGFPRVAAPKDLSPDPYGNATNLAQRSQAATGRPITGYFSSGESSGNSSGNSSGAAQEILDQRSQNAVEEVGAMIWRMHIGDSGETSFTGPSGNFSMSDSSMPPGDENHHSQFLASGCVEQTPLFTTFAQDTELKQHLIELFMTYINPLHMFLDVKASFSPAEYPHRDLSQQLLHTAVFAAGARYAQRKDIGAISDLLMKHAETIALSCCRRHPSVRVVQALGLLCWRELTYQHDDMAWIYNGMLPFPFAESGHVLPAPEVIAGRANIIQKLWEAASLYVWGCTPWDSGT